jgi:hypothetical protein
MEHSSNLIAFADQAGNLAGLLFPLSLLPYLIFLYFLRQDVNGLSPVAKAGFTFLLAFVAGTVGCSIVAVKSYGLSLANVDWLHSGCEQLLAFTNIINVIGLKLTLDGFNSGKVTQPATATQVEGSFGELPVVGIFSAIAALACAVTWFACGGDLEAHTAYLGGLGNLPDGLLPLTEPDNALSLPTWVIHASSLLEWLVSMGLVWRIGIASGNPRWKGMTWAMIPSHSSGVCACVYHIFYNAPQFVVLAQSALTLLGNTTLAVAAYRVAASNGWKFSLPTLPGGGEANQEATTGSGKGDEDEAEDSKPSGTPVEATDAATGILTVCAWAVLASYVVKYGGAAVPNIAEAPDIIPASLIILVTSFNVWKWNQRSQTGGDFKGLI